MTSAREHIIETTCDLLEMQGYHATGLNQIIKESGSPKGSLYYYFPGGKEELAVEAVRQVGATVLNRIRENLQIVDNPAEAVQLFIRNIAIQVERSGFRAGGPITTIALETAGSSELLREACEDIYSGWRSAFAQKLENGGIEDSRAARIAGLIIASIEGGVILCRTAQSREPLEFIADELSILIRHAL